MRYVQDSAGRAAVQENGFAADGADNPTGISSRHHFLLYAFCNNSSIQLTALSPMVTLGSLMSLLPNGLPLHSLKKLQNDLPAV